MMRLAFGVWLTLMFTVCGCASNALRQPGGFYPNSPGSYTGGSDAAAGGVTEIAHIASEKSALAASLDRLVATGVSPAPDFARGYQEGRRFTIGAEQAIEIMVQTISRPPG